MVQPVQRLTVETPVLDVLDLAQITSNVTEAVQSNTAPIDTYYQVELSREPIVEIFRTIPEPTTVEAKNKEKSKLHKEKTWCTAGIESVFSVFELASGIIERISVQDIYSLNFVNREFHYTVQNITRPSSDLLSESFILNRFGSSGWMLDRKSKLLELDHIEKRILRAKECLESAPVVASNATHELMRFPVYVVMSPTTGGLSVEWNAKQSESFIRTLGGNIAHTCKQNFVPQELYANGIYCLGYEGVEQNKNVEQVVRRISDWERMAALPTDSTDDVRTKDYPFGVERKWRTWGFNNNQLIRAYFSGVKCGTIEVYDEFAGERQTSWHHPGLTRIYIRNNNLISFNDPESVAQVFVFGHKDKISEFAVTGLQKRLFTHGEFISAIWDGDSGENVETYAIVDGSVNRLFSNVLMSPANYYMEETATLRDKSIVVQYRQGDFGPHPDYHFRIISSQGECVNSFYTQTACGKLNRQPVIFMDQFIVTYGDDDCLHIWSKTGEILYSDRHNLLWVFDSGLGELIGEQSERVIFRNRIGKDFFRWSWVEKTSANESFSLFGPHSEPDPFW